MGKCTKMKYTITVMLKPGMVDVQGLALEQKLHTLGYNEFINVHMGKVITFEVLPHEEQPDTFERVKEACETLLSNDVIESYSIAEPKE